VTFRSLAAAAAAAALALGGLAALPPAAAAQTPTVVTAPTALAPKGRWALGDSVMVGAKTALNNRGFIVNAKTSRQFSTAVPLVKERLGWLPRNVVIHLGTNGYISLYDCKRVVSLAGSGRRVFLVTTKAPRQWQAANNRTIRACDASFAAGRVMVIDWYRAAVNNPSWLYSDGIHLTSTGRLGYARLVDAFVDANRL
jgi:lysophospholipase L1-like esterase